MEKKHDRSSDSHKNLLTIMGLLGVAVLVYGFWGAQHPVKRPQLYSHIPEPVQIGKSGGRELSDEELERLLTTPSPLRGFQNKTGVLDLVKWLPELQWWRTRQLNQWFEGVKNGSLDVLTQPFHVEFGCEVYVNHDYRYFLIKQCKTGSSTLRSNMRSICKGKGSDKTSKLCSTYPWINPMPERGDPSTWWMDYFVFTTVRNPYSRFPSAYRYLQSDNYLNQSMGESCRNPFLIHQENASWSHGSDHYMRHMMEQTSCLFTSSRGMAVDFIAQTENMEEDFKVIVQEINKRRRSDVPPMNETVTGFRNRNPQKGRQETYAPLYRQYPECIEMVEKIYRSEFEDLQYLANS